MTTTTQPPAGTPVLAKAGRLFDTIWTGWFRDIASVQSELVAQTGSSSTDITTLQTSLITLQGTVTTVQSDVTTLKTYKGIIQVQFSETGAVATGSTVLPRDNTTPQNTEGDQYMSLAITPASATNILIIEAVLMFAADTANVSIAAALFQDSAANALAVISEFGETAAGERIIVLKHRMVAGTASSTTFKVRAGPNIAATVTFNGASGGRYFGGVSASSLSITEYLP